ncbi:MAG: hypothetical protein IJU14_03890 [Clostridia bacterium]|nr:hypothetical protein [Clostridia bacterium]
MEKREETKEMEIDLSFIFRILRKNVIPLVLSAIVFGVCAYVGTTQFIPKQYKASAQLIVNNRSDTSERSVNNSELTAAQSLANTYSVIIKSNSVLQPVIDKMQLNMTYESLANSITVAPVNETQVIEISMKSTDPSFAKKVIANVVTVAQPKIKDVVEAGSVKVVDDSRIANNGRPIGPNAKKNALLGAIGGLAFMLVIVFLKELFNKKFKTESDITNTLGLPMMGVIPYVDGKDFSK